MGNPSRVRVTGPLQPYAAGFRDELRRLGYRPNAAADQLRLMAHVSRWLEVLQFGVGDLTPDRVDEFLCDRRAAGYTLWLSPKATEPMLVFLRGLGVAPDPPPTPRTAAEELMEVFRSYLVEERGLAESTVTSYVYVAGLFLDSRFVDEAADLGEVTTQGVTEFVLAETADRSVGYSQFVGCGLRAFLRFAYATGRTPIQVDEAVPKIASWRQSGVPRSISRTEVEALLAACDRRTTFGRRDYAALVLMIRLGLRAGEVAALDLDDVDWRAGEVVIRGKGNRTERLPLPSDVGDAVAGWIRRGRPRCDTRAVFTRVRAPHQALSVGGVGAIVRSAASRANLSGINAHRLRHTAATGMLAAGADLAEIGQVLRHTSVLTTAIYAKVDDLSLRPLALPWPQEVVS
jgi:integrase/recombinase XerD